ncbi:MAG: LytTR family DNA-binding domain-containing protein [Mariniphaga sp.]
MKAIIIEDEQLAVRNLETILNELGGFKILAAIDSIEEAVEWFSCHSQPDIVFMDIHLADGSAFEIFKKVLITCPIIFTTAYDEYALKAFKVNSVDYLLKPINKEDVNKALDKLKTLVSERNEKQGLQDLIALYKKGSSYKTHFLVPVKGDKLIPLQSADIAYIFLDASLVKAFTYGDKSYVLDITLDELTKMLDPQLFFRANRQFIIARNAIKDIDLWFNSRLSVNLKVSVGEKILVSKARIPEFKSWFAGV